MNIRVRTWVVLSIALFLLAPLPRAFAALTPVDVPEVCTVVDTDGAPHTYSGEYLGICALEAAKTQGVVSAYTLQNFSFGLFLQSLNGIVPGETEFWSLSLNNIEASVGLADLVVAEGDTLTFQLTDWSTNTKIGSPIEFSVQSLLASGSESSPPPQSGGGGGEFLEDRLFSPEFAFDFLVTKQHPDGSFGSPMQTDWVAIAFGITLDEACNDACPEARKKLRAYVANAPISTSSATELERHIMALEALGVDPYTAPGSPVEALTTLFDGTQMGNSSLVNDDIFAIFPLLHAGYSDTDPMMRAVVSFILSKQKINGSWEDSVDLTAAAIQALKLFSEDIAIERAKEYLHRNQNDSGIFGTNSFSLSWALQAIGALGETPEEWRKSGVTPFGYLGIFQQDDGGVEPKSMDSDTRVWATAYAIPAAFGKPWNELLQSFVKPVHANSGDEQESAQTYTATAETTHTRTGDAASPTLNGTLAPRDPTPIENTAEEVEVMTSAQLAAVGTVADAVGTPWFDTSWLLIIFSILGLTALVTFLWRLWENGGRF